MIGKVLAQVSLTVGPQSEYTEWLYSQLQNAKLWLLEFSYQFPDWQNQGNYCKQAKWKPVKLPPLEKL